MKTIFVAFMWNVSGYPSQFANAIIESGEILGEESFEEMVEILKTKAGVGEAAEIFVQNFQYL